MVMIFSGIFFIGLLFSIIGAILKYDREVF